MAQALPGITDQGPQQGPVWKWRINESTKIASRRMGGGGGGGKSVFEPTWNSVNPLLMASKAFSPIECVDGETLSTLSAFRLWELA